MSLYSTLPNKKLKMVDTPSYTQFMSMIQQMGNMSSPGMEESQTPAFSDKTLQCGKNNSINHTPVITIL
jgi:hypothetical protein